MKKITTLSLLCLLCMSMASAAMIDATIDSNGGEVTTYAQTDDAYSEFTGSGKFTASVSSETKHLPKYNGAAWASAESTNVLDTTVTAQSKGANGASFSFRANQVFQKGKSSNANQAGVAILSAKGDRASMNAGFRTSENRATIDGFDGSPVVMGEATKAASDFGVSMALFNIDAKKLDKDLITKSNSFVISEGGKIDGKGKVSLFKTQYGQSAVAATHGHTSGAVDFYSNNNVALSGDAGWSAFNTDSSVVMGAQTIGASSYHGVYAISG